VDDGERLRYREPVAKVSEGPGKSGYFEKKSNECFAFARHCARCQTERNDDFRDSRDNRSR
jgi:hypothetical protein